MMMMAMIDDDDPNLDENLCILVIMRTSETVGSLIIGPLWNRKSGTQKRP